MNFMGYWRIVRRLHRNAVIFSDVGTGVSGSGRGRLCWGTCWFSINLDSMHSGELVLPTSIPAGTDVLIRPGWFNHSEENDKVKISKELMNRYY